MKNRKQPKFTEKDFEHRFPNNDACLEWLKNHLYPDGIYCPVCKKVTKFAKLRKRPVYACDICRYQVSPLAGTIFHKSPTPLKVWFKAIYEMSTTRNGYPALELQRDIGVTYKTAWRMLKLIRAMLDEKQSMFSGEVEIDETYVGGARHGVRGRGALGKIPVVGIAQRKGKVMASVVPNVKRSTIVPMVNEYVAKDAIVYTDEFPIYDHFTYIGFKHHRINHQAKQYVNGRVHTNNIEGFWSLVKRGISGVYHSVSPKYLQSYLNEYAFRYNHRNDELPMFVLVLKQIR